MEPVPVKEHCNTPALKQPQSNQPTMSAAVQHKDNAAASKDPLATCNIPEVVEDRRHDPDGRMISQKYARGKLLGKGGFAKVFVGNLLSTKTPYALKIVAKSSLVKERAKQKLQTEIKIHKSLRHANVVRFERFFEDSKFAFMILELCDHNSMSELMKRRKRLSEPETRYYSLQLVDSLQYLHQHLVIHRDLKLGNLFIDGQMRLKVGDFGLASKLSYPSEKRRTICGTPNYIAPEILEGKSGHSFEVDIWSTGVVIYTLLVGKPPFESKDVKSTYKRILANQYHFPDHSPVSADAKSLIRRLLQSLPTNRPSLQMISEHPFFTRSTAILPSSLPESSLRECPASFQAHAQLVSMKSDSHPSSTGDENDPNAINRMPQRSHSATAGTLARKSHENIGGYAASRASSASANSGRSASRGRTGTESKSSTNMAAAVNENGSMKPATTFQTVSGPSTSSTVGASTGLTTSSSGRMITRSLSTGTATTGVQNTYAGYSSSRDAKDRATDRLSNRQGLASSSVTMAANKAKVTSYAQKFDIYVDQQAAQATGTATEKSPRYSHRSTDRRNKQSDYLQLQQLGEPTSKKGDEDVDRMAIDLDNVRLSPRPHGEEYPSTRGSDVHSRTSNNADAWTWKEGKDKFPPSRAVEPPSDVSEKKNAFVSGGTGYQMSTPSAEGKASKSEPEIESVAQESEPMNVVVTPQEQVMKETKPLGTLEAMHQMLDNSFSAIDQQGGIQEAILTTAVTSSAPSSASGTIKSTRGSCVKSPTDHDLVAKVWVVRYVDYTSKYGLGFLFNTGSAGVYFNDSTKIVLSADGTTFQYTERRRKDSSNGSEHSSQKHLITSYPLELQKKVTLLKHFRNYLVDQHKSSGGSAGQESAECNRGGADAIPPMDSKVMNLNGNQHGLTRSGVSSEGANPQVKFGQSSTKHLALEENNIKDGKGNGGDSLMMDDDCSDVDMPFLKKWVRTKHAILFRISNRTVQVVFYDRSEVLLSSEARVITYVNKQGVRTEHSLDEVLTAGRLDIAKRLKYTKDIMYRLISTQSR